MREIQGDRLELSRIRLERDIDNHIPPPPSMSDDNFQDGDDDDDDDVSSVDFARHGSHPHPSFHSFEHLSHLDSDFYSRHGDDDSIALDPDLGHTMSTAAHHASALTLSAGLRGRGHGDDTTGRASPSGAEFDPERPLQAMLNSKITHGMSLFDASVRSKSKSAKSLKPEQTRSVLTYDPPIVDSTAELDRLLDTGHKRSPASRSGVSYPYISRSHSQPAPGASDASDSDVSVPRLSQALGQQFSPKRPRSTPISTQHFSLPLRPQNPTPNRTAHPSKHKSSTLSPGPSNLNPAKHQSKHATFETNPQDPHPIKTTKGNNRDVGVQSRHPSRESENQNPNDLTPRPHRRLFPSAPGSGATSRPAFTNIVNKTLDATKHKDTTKPNASTRVRLPDVTGITSAVQSPVKGGDGYVAADVGHPSLTVDLIGALDGLQKRLHTLERENGVSRRRVQELEYELEECKAEVVKERTRVKERERELDDEVHIAREREKERHIRGRMRQEEARYREVVEEKKALEALVTTLREHLTRLTSEVASHKSIIAGLRVDAYAAREAQAEVEALHAEVERLAGEVERLKEVVEEGLRERRRAKLGEDGSRDISVHERDQSTGPAQLGIDMTYVTAPVSRGEEMLRGEEPLTVEDLEPELEQEYEQQDEDVEHPQEEEEPLYERGLRREPLSEHQMEPDVSRSNRYIQASELARVESEMRERRSERSSSTSKLSAANSQVSNSRDGHSSHEAEASNDRDQGPSPASSAPRPPVQPSRLRPSDQSNHVPRQRNVTPPKQPTLNTPFPQIRGSRMERLFFSAPEHNARTCTVCHRRKRSGERRMFHQDEHEDDDVLKSYLRNKGQRAKGRNKRSPGSDGPNAAEDELDVDGDRLPPQTVLARVVRELEDDFSHYKAIYMELAEQYGLIDATSNVAKRNVLADHLREVIDTLEQKGDQIASLYDLLNFKDKPVSKPAPSKLKHATFV